MAKSKPKKKKALSASDILKKKTQSAHKRVVRSALQSIGFDRVVGATELEVTFDGTKSDFDDIFMWKNVWLLVEYTTLSDGHADHLKKKWFLYQKILSHSAEFVHHLAGVSPAIKSSWIKKYPAEKIVVRVLYCSKEELQESLKSQTPKIAFFDYPIAMYFKALGNAIKHSARPELLRFLRVDSKDAGDACLKTTSSNREEFEGSILPQGHSNLGEKFTVVSFYASPEALLERSYVLRKDGWMDSEWLYQRMISTKKINAIRNFLRSKKRVFLNNIVLSLPASTQILADDGSVVSASAVNKTQPTKVSLVREANTVGLIDGQHRVFAYHEGGKYDSVIKPLREKLNLLVTGVIYPKDYTNIKRAKFEASLFLEINSNQTSANSEIKQAITSILDPYDAQSIGKRVLTKLNRNGPLEHKFLTYFYDKDRVKTTSVVSYGLRHLVNPKSSDGLYKRWNNQKKGSLVKRSSMETLDQYVDYCFTQVSQWFGMVKKNLPPGVWTYDKNQPGHMLNTTTVIGLINCFRWVCAKGGKLNIEYYDAHLTGLSSFNFKNYKSSQYGAMGRDLFAKHFPELVQN